MSSAPTATFAISKVELWVIRTAGACLIATLGWIGVQFQTALVHIAEIRKELDVVKPADILAAVNDLEKHSLTKAEVESIVKSSAPWLAVAGEWRQWKLEIEKRLHSIEIRTNDRFTRTDMREWLLLLKRNNNSLEVPLLKAGDK